MENKPNVSGNSEIANPGVEEILSGNDSDSANPNNESFDSGEFFTALDKSVSGAVYDDEQPEVTPEQDSETGSVPSIETNTVNQEIDTPDWEKRYGDSSREAQRMKAQLDELKPFVPVLDAMKQDTGLVEHVRNYLLGDGNKPSKSVMEKLNLDEDFTFDGHEAVTEPDSDSAKMLNAHVDTAVAERVNQILGQEKQRAVAYQDQAKKAKEAEEFKKSKGYTDEEFNEFISKAKSHVLTLEDAEMILNKDKVKGNIANATKTDMLEQMKNVQKIPSTQSGTNNAASPQKSPDDIVFDAIKGMDDDLENLFG